MIDNIFILGIVFILLLALIALLFKPRLGRKYTSCKSSTAKPRGKA